MLQKLSDLRWLISQTFFAERKFARQKIFLHMSAILLTVATKAKVYFPFLSLLI